MVIRKVLRLSTKDSKAKCEIKKNISKTFCTRFICHTTLKHNLFHQNILELATPGLSALVDIIFAGTKSPEVFKFKINPEVLIFSARGI